MTIIKPELGVLPQEKTTSRVEDFETALQKRLDALVAAKERWSIMRAGIENGYAVNEEEFARITQDLDNAMEAVGDLRGAPDQETAPSPDTESSGVPPQGPDTDAETTAPAPPEPEAPAQAEPLPAENDFDIDFESAPAEVRQNAELTLDEIEGRWRAAKAGESALSQGQPLEESIKKDAHRQEAAHWEQERDDLLARERSAQASVEADRLEGEMERKRMQRDSLNWNLESEYLKAMKLDREIRKMAAERRQLLKPGIFRRMRNEVGRIFEKATFKAKERWRAIPEPVKNVFTLGGWFAYHTEKLRRETRQVGTDLREQFEGIAAEQNMSLAEAQEEANRMQEILKSSGREGINSVDLDFVDRLITREKREKNEKRENEIVAGVIEDLKKKAGDQTWLAEHGMSDGKMLTHPDNLQQIETDIRSAVRQVREGQVRRDMIDYTKILRRNLNPTWWRRAVYWGVERAIMGLKN